MLRPSLPALLVSALAVLLLAACAAAPGVRDLPVDARNAETLYLEGDFRGAADAWLIAAGSSRAHRDFYRLRAAEALREEGDLTGARRTLADLNPRSLSDEERQRLALLQAELALAGGDPRLALDTLGGPAQRVAPAQRARFHELRGRALEAQQQPFAAAAEYAALDALLQGPDRADNSARISRLVGSLDDMALIDGSASLPAGHPLQPYAARALSIRGLAMPERFRRSTPTDDRGFRPLTRGPRTVALLLPQAGPMRLASASVRDGFMAAHFAQPMPRPQVRIYDSGENPQQAIDAYRQAVAEGADVVVGPLAREAVSALFEQPQLPVPVVGLNRSSAPVPPGSMSFALAPDEEAAAVAGLLQQRGLRRVVAVVGSDDSAQRALAGFTARHLQGGGELLGTVLIPDSGVDYQPAIRRMLQGAGLPTVAPKELSREHHAGFDAVFLALRPTQARLAMPQLRIFGVIDVPTFATSTINAVDDDERLDRDLNGIEFAEVPWVVADLPGLPSRSELVQQLDTARGPAARLFAFGLDAYRLLVDPGLQQGGMHLDGATGRIEVDAFGEARRVPGFATFRNQRARLIDAGALLPDGESAR
jgi:uncharacterized protein